MPAVNYEKRAETNFNRLLNDPHITSINKEHVKQFADEYFVRPARKALVFDKLRVFLLQSKDFKKEMWDQVMMKSVLKVLYKERRGTFETFRNIVRMFARRLNDDEPVKPLHKAFKIFPKEENERNVTPEERTSLEERDLFIGATNSLQLKAMIATEIDAGFRPSEFVDLDYGDVIKISPPYVWFRLRKENNKTKRARDVWIFRATPYFLKWYYAHPTKKKTDPLWIQENGTGGKIKRYEYRSVINRIEALKKKVTSKDVTSKPVDFYAWRNSAIAIAKKDKVPLEEAVNKFGHSPKHFIKTYAKLSKEETEEKLAPIHHINKPDIRKENPPLICKRCDFTNSPGAEICDNCAYALSEGKKDEEFRRLIEKMEKNNQQTKLLNSFMNKVIERNPDIAKAIAKEATKSHIPT